MTRAFSNGIMQTEVKIVPLTHLSLSLPLSIPLFHPHRPSSTSSTSTTADLQSAQHPRDSETRESLSLEQQSHDCSDEDDSEDEGDDANQVPLLQEEQRSMSWPGSLPNHLIKFPSNTNVLFNSDSAQLRAQSTATSAVSSTPSASCFSHPLWAVGSSTLKPTSITSSSPALTLSKSFTTPVTSLAPSFIYSMFPPQNMGLPQPMLTPLLTIMPSGALVSTAGITESTQPLTLAPKKPSSLPTLACPSGSPISTMPSLPVRRESSSSSVTSPQITCSAESSTGQSMQTFVGEQMSVLSQVPPQRTLASIPPSEMTPQYIELKAFAEEFKTRRIRLGYTQGSVGQSLARKGYSNFAQSTISRFEQMQLSATNAAAIKQVLEKWLQETEFPESVTSTSSDTHMMASRKRKKRAVFTQQTKSTLDKFFCQNPRPNRQAIESIAQQLDLLPEEVRVWFCNKRQKQKLSSTSSTSSYHSVVSPTSSGIVSLGSPSFSPKQRSPSPKTSFTIEELSKSSSTSTSPVPLTNPFSISPTTLSFSTASRVFPLVMPTTTLPHLTITQTRA